MSAKRRKRRAGAGRKPLDPKGSVVAPVRFTADDWKDIKRLASRNGRDASKEVRAAVHYWLRLLEKPQRHTGALICLIAILVRRIEARTDRKWHEDAATGAAVREEVGRLIESFAPVAKKRLVVRPDLRQITHDLIVITAHLFRDPQLAPVLSGDDDWAALAMIAKDLGPALLRSIDKTVVTIREVKS
jgi:hypothetical protein